MIKKAIIPVLTVSFLLSACEQKPATLAAQSIAAPDSSRPELTPADVSDVTWKNGILIKKDELNGFFVMGDAAKVAPAIGSRLAFATSGVRIVREVVINAPYVNIYVDKPLDPIGDGYPHKVLQ